MPRPSPRTAPHWGTFLEALVAVGLISADEALRRWLERGDRLSTEEVAAIVRTARRDCIGVLEENVYEEYRKAKAVELGRSFPSSRTVIDKLGAPSFDAAVAIAERMATGASRGDHDGEERL